MCVVGAGPVGIALARRPDGTPGWGAAHHAGMRERLGRTMSWSIFTEDLPEFVMKALAPAKVTEVRIDESTGTAEVIVPDYQLSLAIGRRGQNGVRIDADVDAGNAVVERQVEEIFVHAFRDARGQAGLHGRL